jgi:PPOX class probable F420-dependent enzyme
MAAKIEGKARELLEAPNFAHVATVRADGSPLSVVVWVDVDGDNVVLNSGAGRAWPNNLERDPHVALTIAPSDNPYQYLSIRGRAVEITPDGAEEHIDKLAKKYLGQDTYPFRQPGEQRIKLRIAPEDVKIHGG